MLRTPVEVLVRLGGLDLRQGAATSTHRAGVAVALAAAVVAVAMSPHRREDRDAWWRRACVFMAGVLPFAGLVALSTLGIGVLNDRYAHGATFFLPLGLIPFVTFRRPVPGAHRVRRARLHLALHLHRLPPPSVNTSSWTV